ncbi:PQQ-dependent sugar dehydrogenase [Pseudomonas syringae]|uniref:PQQ-dependent sugar dehydrogenase n=1 Tax=Pseudomonas syringae TaxID=317 RepID=UPI000E32C45C|nr:sorbosone dehydrogenase family protein [Pseudomonas syringae]
MRNIHALTALSMALLLSACGGEADSTQARGPDPKLPDPQRGLLPSMKIAEPTAWGDQKPAVPEGFSITAIASDLNIPRQSIVLPNGDIIVAEGRGGSAAKLKPKDVIASVIKAQGNTKVKSGNRLTLLRDADGDGKYELKTVFAENLNAPYGLAFANGKLYVANQDALVSFDYQEGQTKASGEPTKVTDLPAAINHHWTKALTASPDGRYLYVGIGSNSNVTERGMEVEIDRAMVWQIDAATGAHKPYATGLRNPTALAIQPGTGQLWTVVNERDELGPDLVPDYLTSVKEGAFYGWPYSYYGQHVDERVKPQNPALVAKAIAPDYAVGPHTASLGLVFADGKTLAAPFNEGLFIGQHGSWNRKPHSGYKVVFIPFSGGKPNGTPVDVLTGFLNKDEKAMGRPVGVVNDQRGGLLVADDVGNKIWRVTSAKAAQ